MGNGKTGAGKLKIAQSGANNKNRYQTELNEIK